MKAVVGRSFSRGVINTINAPQAIGPYVQGTTYNELVFTSGQIGLLPNGEKEFLTIQEQSHQVMKNLKTVLEAGGSDMSSVLKCTCFITDMNNFAAFNEVYTQYFEDLPLPARSCVEVPRQPKDMLIEVEAVAYKCEGNSTETSKKQMTKKKITKKTSKKHKNWGNIMKQVEKKKVKAL